DPDALTTLAGRLARLEREFTADQRAELRELAGGKSLPDLAHDLLRATDPDAILARSASEGIEQPTEAQLESAVQALTRAAATPTQLWRAFQAVETDKVAGLGGSQLADLVALVRHALIPDFLLAPYADQVRARYQAWLIDRDAGNTFTPEQRRWLDRIADHI